MECVVFCAQCNMSITENKKKKEKRECRHSEEEGFFFRVFLTWLVES